MMVMILFRLHFDLAWFVDRWSCHCFFRFLVTNWYIFVSNCRFLNLVYFIYCRWLYVAAFWMIHNIFCTNQWNYDFFATYNFTLSLICVFFLQLFVWDNVFLDGDLLLCYFHSQGIYLHQQNCFQYIDRFSLTNKFSFTEKL